MITDVLAANAGWLLPLELVLAITGVALFCLRSPRASEVSWPVIDLLWIGSSAVTLYFLATGMLYDQEQRSGQLSLNNYMSHVQRGIDQSNVNLETWCLGASRRRASVAPEELGVFCELNSRALSRFTQAASAHETHGAIARIPAAEKAPLRVAPLSPGQDALILDELWRDVRSEMLWLNENHDELMQLKARTVWLSTARKARILWLYVFVLLIAARLGRPIWDLRSKGSEPVTEGATDAS